MMNTVLEQVVANSKNDLIIFFVLVVVVVMAIAVPIYKIGVKARNEKMDMRYKREQLLMGVVSNNSTVISKLTTIIENNNKTCDECKIEQTTSMNNVSMKQDEVLRIVETVAAVLLDRKENQHG